jgi:signal transduction histidine kinase
LSCIGLVVAGLHSISVDASTTLDPVRTDAYTLGAELDPRLSLGLFTASMALIALTLSGRKRVGAALGASLSVTVAIVGVSALGDPLLGLQSEETSMLLTMLTCTLFPTIAFGLSRAAYERLKEFSGSDDRLHLIHNLSGVTGACLGLIAVSVLLTFQLTAREADDARRLNESRRFRELIREINNGLDGLVADVDQLPESGIFARRTEETHDRLEQLRAVAAWPEHQQPFAAASTEIRSQLELIRTAFEQRQQGQDREANQTVAVLRIAHSQLSSGLSTLDESLRDDALNRTSDRANRRRNTAVALSAAGVSIVVLLGAVHLLFQRDSVSRQRAEAALRRHNETLKSFAHTIAHDLRAPLRGIAGYAAELDGQSHTLDARGRHCVAQINTAAHHLERMIGDTLNYAQLDAETPNLGTISLPTLVASLLQQRAAELRQHGTLVDTHFGIVTVTSWERGLVQIVGNLLDNAIKYSRHAHPPRLRIETAQTPLSWRLVIYDNGVGFDMKYHDRIFGLFQRLVTSEEFEGTGAGLAIVRKITDRLGGTVCAEGKPGGGATFLVELPRVLSSELA